jgi:spore germination cell wall hydrolase CwlJ-like protein
VVFYCLNLVLVQVSAAANGGLNGAVASHNPQAVTAEQWATMGQQDYKNAAMYYGADGYPYYYGGEALRHLIIVCFYCLFVVN